MTVHGALMQRCAMSAQGGVDFGELGKGGARAEIPVALYCNVPFRMEVRAEHGALTNDRQPGGEGPYAGSLAYELGLSIPLRSPAESVLRREFESRALVGGQSVSSGGGIALDGMRLQVALAKPMSEAGLLAGSYSENIVITVATI